MYLHGMSLESRDSMYRGIGGSIWRDVPGMSLVSGLGGVYMGGCTWDVLGILGYHVLRDWGGLYGGKYLGCPSYPRILCIEGLRGLYGGMYLGIPGYYDCIEVYGGMYLGCPCILGYNL